jgi:hypothetical protein
MTSTRTPVPTVSASVVLTTCFVLPSALTAVPYFGFAVGPRHGMPTVCVQQFGPGLYDDSRSPQIGQARTPVCALATGLRVAPVGRVPEAIEVPPRYERRSAS